MKVILFGATGMVGQGVLRECLLDPRVEAVLSLGRSATGQQHPKLRELVHRDLLDYAAIESDLSGYDACFFCLGVTSAGMSAADYRRITYDVTLAAANVLARLNPQMTFVFVSGAGTGGKQMWARVKADAENALLKLPFKAAYMFRPAIIQPLHGIRSRTASYRVFYAITRPLLPLLKRALPKYMTTTEQIGRAMIAVAMHGAPGAILETVEINRAGATRSSG
jgi:uncharacterized protein YbjT (DUF2867 family)